MMVNYPAGGPLLQPHGLQPVRYPGYGVMNAESGAEDLYYQIVDPAALEAKPRRPAYNRSLNAVENWAWLTQRLVELEQLKMQERMGGAKQSTFGESVVYDVDADEDLARYDEYDAESDDSRPRARPRRGQGRFKSVHERVLQRWERLTQKVLERGGATAGWARAAKMAAAQPTGEARVAATWKRLALKMSGQPGGPRLRVLGPTALR